MNARGRHELARAYFIERYSSDRVRAVRASTKAPIDVILLRPNGGHLRPIFVEVKTSDGRVTSDLSEFEEAFGRWAESQGSPYVVARYDVKGKEIRGEELHRPFAPKGDAEIQFEVAG